MKFRIISALVASAAILPFAAQAEGLSYTLRRGWLPEHRPRRIQRDGRRLGPEGLLGDHRQLVRVRPLRGPDDGRRRRRNHVPAVGHRRRLRVADRRADGHLRHGRLRERRRWTSRASVRHHEHERRRLHAGRRRSHALRRAASSSRAPASTQNLSDYGDEFDFGVHGRWYITDMFALGRQYNAGDETSTFGGGVRLQF